MLFFSHLKAEKWKGSMYTVHKPRRVEHRPERQRSYISIVTPVVSLFYSFLSPPVAIKNIQNKKFKA